MATKFNLKITTPHGEFTRTATKLYTHAVVRTSPRAMEAYEQRAYTPRASRNGVHGRWIKDRGFAVTWHGSLKAAQAAAARPYMWDAVRCGQGEVFSVVTQVTAVLEDTSHLDSDGQSVARALQRLVSKSPDLDAAEQTLRNYTDWFIYRGGSHIAVSLASGDERRILFVTA